MARKVVSWAMLALFPLSVFAADTNAAMLYAKGTAWVNGGQVSDSSAVFPGDLVQTKADSMANINASGSNVIVLSDSLVTFNGNDVSIDHGSVSVKTARGMHTTADDVTVAPVSSSATEFDVSKANGKVRIMALKGDVSITDGTGTTATLSQGQQTTRDVTPATKKRRGGGAAPAAGGGILDSPIAVAVGAAAIGGMITWVALQSPNPASPSTP